MLMRPLTAPNIAPPTKAVLCLESHSRTLLPMSPPFRLPLSSFSPKRNFLNRSDCVTSPIPVPRIAPPIGPPGRNNVPKIPKLVKRERPAPTIPIAIAFGKRFLVFSIISLNAALPLPSSIFVPKMKLWKFV